MTRLLGTGALLLALTQTIGCDRSVRYRCVVEPVARASAQPLVIDVTRDRRGEALEASQALDHDLMASAWVRCIEVDQGSRGTHTTPEGGPAVSR